MKILIFLKIALIRASLVAAIFLIASCTNNQKKENTKDVAEEHNEAKFDNKMQERDAQFLVNAAEINMEEISLGQLAQQIGRSTHVKELGKMMESAHTKSLNDLAGLAKSKIITIPNFPTDEAQDAYKTLNDKSGSDFDKAYADKMVSGHKDAIAMFEKASADANDIDIRNWANAMLPGLRTHLDHAINCQKECAKM